MADSSVDIVTPPSGVTTKTVSTRTNASAEEMQVVVIGVDGSNSVLDPATATKQSDGSQKVQIVDSSGNVIGSSNNTLNVNIKRQDGVQLPLGYSQISLTTAASLGTIPGGSVSALIIPRADIRWRDDGTNPTTSVGMYLFAHQSLEYRGSLSAFRMISISGTTEVNISFYGAYA